MNDLFRAIFGLPSSDQNGKRMDDKPPNDYKNNFSGNDGNDDEDEDNDDFMGMRPSGHIFGFPLFNDPTEIHQHFQQLVNEMNKAFGIFGFNSGSSITWEDEGSNMPTVFNGDLTTKQESLRDSYLKKPDCVCDNNFQRENGNTNLNFKNDFEPGTSNISNTNSNMQISYPKMYSKSIFIQTVKRPDGSVETIKKVRDHTGNEETTITQSNVNDPLPTPPTPLPPPSVIPKDDSSGISIFKKFFSF